MPRTVASPPTGSRFPARPHGRRCLLALACAAAAGLIASWLYRPAGAAQALLIACLTAAATLAILAGAMPPTRRGAALQRRIRDARVTVVDADPDDGTPSDVYELRAFGVSVLVRLREDWKGQPLVPYVHIDHEASRPRLLLVEVDNQGETEYR